jgi:phosphopantothenate synthetase
MTQRFQDIWKDQCDAAEGIAAAHGKVQALDYLIGEKLDTYGLAPVSWRGERLGSNYMI